MSLLSPRSVALVGATEASIWSANLIANFTDLGYTGHLHLVHPDRPVQFGRPCHPDLAAIPEPVDHAYVMTGTGAALGVIEQCGRSGVRSVTMLTAGFREVGPEGELREAKLVARCQELGIELLGPNCLGFVNVHDRVPAYGLLLAAPLQPGATALISQSGAMLLHFHRMSQQRAIGLAHMVSIGNEAMLGADHFIREFVGRPEVRVVGALLEGIRNPGGFLEAAALALAAGKPLVVLKVGRSPAGTRSVAAHTGSLAGADAVVDAVFRQHGVIRVRSLEELLETCALLAARGWPEGGRTAVITTSGGACGLVADLAQGTAIELPDFAPATKARLAALLPVFGTPQNPLDTTGVIVNQPELLGACIEAAAAEDGYDALLINTDPPREPGPAPAALEERLAGLARALDSAPVFAGLAATAAVDLTPFGRETVTRHGLHFGNGLELGVRALAHAIEYGHARRHPPRPAGRGGRHPPPLADGWQGTVSETAAKRLLEAYGVRIPPEWLAAGPAEAAQAAAELGFPVVLKVQSPAISHKTEVGGVRLGLASSGEVQAAAEAMLESVAELGLGPVEGLLVARQVEPVAELVAGIFRDPQFGPVLVAGLGGVFVEVLQDASLRLPPIAHSDALGMLGELRGVAVLEGARGRPAADLDAVAEVLVALGELALDFGDRLLALDVNPLLVLAAGEGALAADALLVLDATHQHLEGGKT